MIRALFTGPVPFEEAADGLFGGVEIQVAYENFFTSISCQFESGLIGEGTQADDCCVAQKHSAGFAEAFQTRFEYSTGGKRRANGFGGSWVTK